MAKMTARDPHLRAAAYGPGCLGTPGEPVRRTRCGEWPGYGNDPGGMRFSPLTQISRKNVARLKTAWVFHTGDISPGGRPATQWL